MPEPIRYELEIETSKGKRQITEALEEGAQAASSGGSGAPSDSGSPKSSQRQENERTGAGNGRPPRKKSAEDDAVGKGADYAAQVIKGLGRHRAVIAGAVAGIFASGGMSLLQGGGSVAGKLAGGAVGAGAGFALGGPVGAIAGAAIGSSILGPLAESIFGLPMKFMQLGESLSQYNGQLFGTMSMFKLSLEGLRFEIARKLAPQITEIVNVGMKILDQLAPYIIGALQSLSRIALNLTRSFGRMISGAERLADLFYRMSGLKTMDILTGGEFTDRLQGGLEGMVTPSSFLSPEMAGINFGRGFFRGIGTDGGDPTTSYFGEIGKAIHRTGFRSLQGFARDESNIHGQQGGASRFALTPAANMEDTARSSMGMDATQRLVDKAGEGSALPRPTPAVANFHITDHIELQLADEERLHNEMMHILQRVEQGIWKMRDDTFLKISRYGAKARSAVL